MVSPVSPLLCHQDLLRAVSGTLIFLVVALVALASSRDALAATTFVSVPKPRPSLGHTPLLDHSL